MRDKDKWAPSKYVYKKGRLMASRDENEVGIGSRLMADLIAEAYDENICKYVKGSLIDLGCGNVPLYEAYRKYIDDNICVDWDKSFHRDDFLDNNCDFSKKIPYNDGEFNTIILSDVLEHIPEPKHLFIEMNRILTPGGKALINVPFLYWVHEQPYDYFRYTGNALQYLAEQSGFRIILIKTIGGAPQVIADILSKNILRLPIAGRYMAIAMQYIGYLFTRIKSLRKFSEKTGQFFPLGFFIVLEKVKKAEE